MLAQYLSISDLIVLCHGAIADRAAASANLAEQPAHDRHLPKIGNRSQDFLIPNPTSMSIDLSLRRIEALVCKFETYNRPTVHIAGTNGKGSVSALLTSVFRHAGLSVGRFNSPHLLHPSDSITLNGTPISREDYLETTREVRKKNEEHAINASSFEVLTVCALLVFERARVDVVLLEVGMGGRLDATNVIPDECILVSVITTIDLDHQAFLGPTVDAIAREKAGIIRKGKPVIVASQIHENVPRVFQKIAKEKGAQLVMAPIAKEREWDEIDGERLPPFSLHPFTSPPPRPVQVEISPLVSRGLAEYQSTSGSIAQNAKYRVLLPLHGSHQLVNLGVALTALHALRSRASSASDIDSFPPSSSTESPSTPIPLHHRLVYHRLAQMDERMIHDAVRNCSWPGRLSFHLYRDASSIDKNFLASELQAVNQMRHEPLAVLVDGAHNESAARTLSAYVSSLLSSLSPPENGAEGKKRQIRLTVVVALSHSPPKTPASVLVPLLSPFIKSSQESSSDPAVSNPGHSQLRDTADLTTHVAFLRFSPPEDMPWVRPVPPSAMREVVCDLLPGISGDSLWVAPDAGAGEEEALQDLKKALQWASKAGGAESGEDEEDKLVLVAGSLYLVADFYRLLQL